MGTFLPVAACPVTDILSDCRAEAQAINAQRLGWAT
jgi:hypothetical protein